MQPTKTGERGITLIALLIMIIIIVIITAVVIRNITGDEPLIGTTSETAEDYKVISYKEEISHVVHSEIISKSAIGETATTGDISDVLNEQDWVKIAYVNADATAEIGNITVQVNEGYVYQVYYNSIYGKIEIDYIGKDIDLDDLTSFTLTARYEKAVTSIFATAEDKKKGIAKLELIYKDQVVMTKDKPTGEQKFDISEIGTGWYKVKATSNSGAVKYAWVKAINISDKLTIPKITIETESIAKNGWYGADKKEVWIKISTTSPSAKEIIYNLTGATIKGETIEKLPEVEEGEEKSIRIKIENCGPTNIMAVTSDGARYESEPNGETVKYDNIPPRITTSTAKEVQGTIGQNGWYTSEEVKITVEAEDPPAGILDGYIYRMTNEITHQTTEPVHQKDITKQISITEDGEYTVYVEAIDQAGNTSPTRTIPIKKDSIKPIVGTTEITNITETSFQVSISHKDDTSKIAYFEYYLNGNLAKTEQTGITTIEGLKANQTYSVKVKAYDNAGNVSLESDTKPVTTKGKLLKPNVTVTGTQRNGYYVGTVTVNITDTAGGTETRTTRLKYTLNGVENTINATSGSFTVTAEGTHNVTAWAEDSIGSKSDTFVVQTFIKDATPPSKASLTLGTVAEKTIAVTASGADATSGIASYKFQYKLSTASSWSTATTKSTTSTSTTYTYSGLEEGKTYNLRVTVADKAGNTYTGSSINGTTKTSGIIPTPTSDIGKYVNYKPTSGSYTAEAKYSGHSLNRSFSTETNLKWRIWNVDSRKLYLISDQPTTMQLTLSNAIGYNNGVTLLDNICNSCYKNSSYSGITARNLKVEDVTAIATVSSSDGSIYGTQPYTYTFIAPYIWTTYEKSSRTNAINNRSTAYSLTTSITSGSTSINPWYTRWYNGSMNTTSAYKNAKYKELVTDPASNCDYWLSSRSVETRTSGHCGFGLQDVSSSGVNYSRLYYGYSGGSTGGATGSRAVRPLVSIPLNSCTLKASSTAGIDYDITAK